MYLSDSVSIFQTITKDPVVSFSNQPRHTGINACDIPSNTISIQFSKSDNCSLNLYVVVGVTSVRIWILNDIVTLKK